MSVATSKSARLRVLREVDWSFVTQSARHPVHSLHPYPAKFVPALPRQVIDLLSDPADLVLDPFCGSGTALVEALLAGRRAIGSDLNPVAVVSSRAKTRRLNPSQIMHLTSLVQEAPNEVQRLLRGGGLALPHDWEPHRTTRFQGLRFWFDEAIAYELAALRELCVQQKDPACRDVLLMCLSAIVVSVSWQDSDTRYVRRSKSLSPGDAVRAFQRKVLAASEALRELSSSTALSAAVYSADARHLEYLEPESVALVVTSPPYPNAWSYHLYHQNRILWLGEDPWAFKEDEIGSHRAYSAKAGRSAADFQDDMRRCFQSLLPALRRDALVVVVVGDSIVRGQAVRNDGTVAEAARAAGLHLVEAITRPINLRRKAFNPTIGNIRSEHILVLHH